MEGIGVGVFDIKDVFVGEHQNILSLPVFSSLGMEYVLLQSIAPCLQMEQHIPPLRLDLIIIADHSAC